MEEDIENGMFPFFVSTTLGTTGCVAFDNLEEIGKSLNTKFEGGLVPSAETSAPK